MTAEHEEMEEKGKTHCQEHFTSALKRSITPTPADTGCVSSMLSVGLTTGHTWKTTMTSKPQKPYPLWGGNVPIVMERDEGRRMPLSSGRANPHDTQQRSEET